MSCSLLSSLLLSSLVFSSLLIFSFLLFSFPHAVAAAGCLACLPLLLPPLAALTYAGLMTAGPFFVSRDKDLGLGGAAVVLDVDKMACYVAEKVGAD